MKIPVIGIFSYGVNDANEYALASTYINAVRRAGGVPLLIPPGDHHSTSIVERLDGIIFSGGGDLNPEVYKGTAHETVYMVDDDRDRSEFDTARLVLEQGKPTFAICRGMQVFNVLLGGTLYEHLPDIVGERVLHRKPPRNPVPHEVYVDKGSKLESILRTNTICPASWHHQGVKKLGNGLKAVAHAQDGVIEAVEMKDHPWFLAVQWHPEITAHEDPTQKKLFDAFTVACRL